MVKKLLAVFILCCISSFLWAQYDIFGEDEEEEEEPAKQKFRLKNRTVELSVAHINFDVSNNFIAAADIFKTPFYLLSNINDIINDPVLVYNDPVVVNLNDFFSGFKLYAGAEVKPLSLNFNWKDKWGFGLDIGHISVAGNISLSENLLTFQDANNDRFGVGAAVFADVGVPVFFHHRDFKIKIRPAVYVPLLYVEPGITYSKKNVSTNGQEGTLIEINYDMRVYSPLNMEGFFNDNQTSFMQDNYWNILRENLGYDFALSIEYPWSYYLDIGVDMVNIPVPFAAARLNRYMQLQGAASVNTSQIDINKIIDGEDVFDDIFDYSGGTTINHLYDSEGKKLYRPFRMLFYLNYRPFDTPFLSLIPSLGFSISNLYAQVGAIEGGLSARFDSANIFITTLGINYNDRRWKNSVDFVLNLRALELDLGLSMQSQDFAKSWQGAGFGLNFGLKFGW